VRWLDCVTEDRAVVGCLTKWRLTTLGLRTAPAGFLSLAKESNVAVPARHKAARVTQAWLKNRFMDRSVVNGF
jgi:hypothetical protein